MALGGKLPRLTTELDGDLTGLAAAFAEGTAMAQAYAEEMDATLTRGFSESGQHAGQAFRDETKRGFNNVAGDIDNTLSKFDKEFATKGRSLGGKFVNSFEDEVKRHGPKAGRAAGDGFVGGLMSAFESAQGLLMPLLIGAIVLASPAIAALIASAVAVGLGLGFAALGTIIAVAMLPKVQKEFQKLANPIRAMFKYAITGAFDEALISAIRAFAKFIPRFKLELRGIFDAVAPLLKPLAINLGKGIGDLLEGFGTALKQAQPAILVWISTIPEITSAIADMLVEITKDPEALSRFITDAAHAIADFLVGAGQVIGWLSSVYNWLVKLNDQDFEFIGWTRKIEGLKIGWNAFTAWFSGAWSSLEAWVKTKASAVGAWFAAIPGAVRRFIGGIPGFFRNLWHSIFYEIGVFAGNFVKFWLNLPAMTLAAMKGLWNFFWGQFTAIVKLVAGLAVKMGAAAVGWIKKLPGRIVAGFKEFKTAVINFFKDSPSWLASAGENLIKGLVNGMKGVVGWAVDKAKSIAHDIAQGFKDALGIKSPSQVFAEIGGNVVAGFVNGVQRSAAMAHSAVQRLVGGPVGGYGTVTPGAGTAAYGGAGGRGGGWGDGDIVVQVDGQTIVRASTPAAQRRASRSGPTGLGFRPAAGFGT